jgi:hypothetical protein
MAQQLRERIDKWEYMKLKSFCTTKEMVSKLKRLLIEWEKIFASYISGNKIIQGAQKLNSPKFKDPRKNRAKELNRTFSK